jgi:hypothetical protein
MWLIAQLNAPDKLCPDEGPANELAEALPPGSLERMKARTVFAGTDRTFELATQHGIRTPFGTHILFSPPRRRANGCRQSSRQHSRRNGRPFDIG